MDVIDLRRKKETHCWLLLPQISLVFFSQAVDFPIRFLQNSDENNNKKILYLIKGGKFIVKYRSPKLPPFNPIPAGGGSNWPPPCSFFLHNLKSIRLRLLKFSDLSYIPKALPLGLKPGFNTNCLSPQAHCQNDCFSCNKLNLCFDPLPLVRFW